MVTFQVPHTLYRYVMAAVWGSALCCSVLPVMARDLSSHLVLHAGAFWLPIGLAFWAPCGARRLRLMGGMASGLWFFSMLFRMLFCWFTVAWGFLYVACLWRFLVRLYTGVIAFRDLFFHPVVVSTSGFSRWLLGTWPGVEVFLATYRKVRRQFLYRLNK